MKQSIKLLAAFIVAGGMCLTSEAGKLHGPYRKDTMQMHLSWNEMQLTITAVVPANNIVGFERIPESVQEKRELRLKDKLIRRNPLIDEESQTICRPGKIDVYTELYTAHTHKGDLFSSIFGPDDSDTVDHTVGDKGRVDYQIKISYRCTKRQPLQLTVFEVFPSIYRVYVRNTDINGKIIQAITRYNPVLRIE